MGSRGHGAAVFDLLAGLRGLLLLGGVVGIELEWNDRRDWLNLRPEILLDSVEGVPVLVGDEVDGETKMAVTTAAADAMEVRLGVLRQVKVDDHVHGGHIDTTGKKI